MRRSSIHSPLVATLAAASSTPCPSHLTHHASPSSTPLSALSADRKRQAHHHAAVQGVAPPPQAWIGAPLPSRSSRIFLDFLCPHVPFFKASLSSTNPSSSTSSADAERSQKMWESAVAIMSAPAVILAVRVAGKRRSRVPRLYAENRSNGLSEMQDPGHLPSVTPARPPGRSARSAIAFHYSSASRSPAAPSYPDVLSRGKDGEATSEQRSGDRLDASATKDGATLGSETTPPTEELLEQLIRQPEGKSFTLQPGDTARSAARRSLEGFLRSQPNRPMPNRTDLDAWFSAVFNPARSYNVAPYEQCLFLRLFLLVQPAPAVLAYLSQSPHLTKVGETLGLDPYLGWRTPVDQAMRRQALGAFVSMVERCIRAPRTDGLLALHLPSGGSGTQKKAKPGRTEQAGGSDQGPGLWRVWTAELQSLAIGALSQEGSTRLAFALWHDLGDLGAHGKSGGWPEIEQGPIAPVPELPWDRLMGGLRADEHIDRGASHAAHHLRALLLPSVSTVPATNDRSALGEVNSGRVTIPETPNPTGPTELDDPSTPNTPATVPKRNTATASARLRTESHPPNHLVDAKIMASVRLVRALLHLNRLDQAQSVVRRSRHIAQRTSSASILEAFTVVQAQVNVCQGKVAEVFSTKNAVRGRAETTAAGRWKGPEGSRIPGLALGSAAGRELAEDPCIGGKASAAGLNRTQRELLALPSSHYATTIAAYGMADDLANARTTFQHALRSVPIGQDRWNPADLKLLYLRMMKVYVRFGDTSSALDLITELRKRGVPPSTGHVNVLLQGYAQAGDIDACRTIFAEMLAPDGGGLSAACPPDEFTYGNLVRVFVEAHDPSSALEVIHDMSMAGFSPSRVVWNTLMNGFAEVGNFAGVAQVYDFLCHQRDPKLQPDTISHSTFLKALVLSGKPTAEVLRLCLSMYSVETGLCPSDAVWTSVLQSIADGGMIDLGEQLFLQLRTGRFKARPTVQQYGILIRAFIRAGRRSVARLYLRDLRESRLPMTSFHYHSLLQLVQGRTPALYRLDHTNQMGIRIAKALTKQRGAVPYHLDNRLTSKAHLEALIWPALQSVGKPKPPERLADAFGEWFTLAGVVPTVASLTAGLRAFAKAQQPLAVIQIWQQLFDHATRKSERYTDRTQPSRSDGNTAEPPVQRNLLCKALSSYIECLRRAKMHAEITKAWQDVKSAGFSFDASNWNQLSLSLLATGHSELAWRIAETILCRQDSDVTPHALPSTQNGGSSGPKPDSANADKAEASIVSLLGDVTDPPVHSPNLAWRDRRDKVQHIAHGPHSLPVILSLLSGRSVAAPDGMLASDRIGQLDLAHRARQRLIWQPEAPLIHALIRDLERQTLRGRENASDIRAFVYAADMLIRTYQQKYPRLMYRLYAARSFRRLHFPWGLSHYIPIGLLWRFNVGRQAWLRRQFWAAVKGDARLAQTCEAQELEEVRRIDARLRERRRRKGSKDQASK